MANSDITPVDIELTSKEVELTEDKRLLSNRGNNKGLSKEEKVNSILY